MVRMTGCAIFQKNRHDLARRQKISHLSSVYPMYPYFSRVVSSSTPGRCRPSSAIDVDSGQHGSASTWAMTAELSRVWCKNNQCCPSSSTSTPPKRCTPALPVRAPCSTAHESCSDMRFGCRCMPEPPTLAFHSSPKHVPSPRRHPHPCRCAKLDPPRRPLKTDAMGMSNGDEYDELYDQNSTVL